MRGGKGMLCAESSRSSEWVVCRFVRDMQGVGSSEGPRKEGIESKAGCGGVRGCR